MIIQEMSWEECLKFLAGTRLARLGCAHKNQPYVVPVKLAYDEASGYLYGFTTPGQKIEWMRANSLVCVEVEEVAAYNHWVSVIAFGRYEELPEHKGSDDAHRRAPERPRLVDEVIRPWSAESGQRHCPDEECDDERERGWQVLKNNPTWPEPCFAAWKARTKRGSAAPFISVFYRIRIDRVTGQKAARNSRDVVSNAMLAEPAGRWGWLRKTILRMFAGSSRETGAAG